MDIKISVRYLKSCLININLKLIIIISALTYLLFSFNSVGVSSSNDGIINILGGFSLNQPPLSIYILLWLIPKLILFYFISIFITNSFQNTLPIIILRVRSKLLWISINTLAAFIAIIFWYIIGYLVVIIFMFIKNGEAFNIHIQYFKMLELDILSTYCIVNIFYLLIIITNKMMPAITVILTIYLSTMFINNPESIIFKLLPSNHGMIVRQQYLSNSFLYVFTVNAVILLLCIFFIKKNELLLKGV